MREQEPLSDTPPSEYNTSPDHQGKASHTDLESAFNDTLDLFRSSVHGVTPTPQVQELGRVVAVGRGTAKVTGLPTVQAEEIVQFDNGLLGLAYNLDPEEVGVVLLGDSRELKAGSYAKRTHRILDVPVGEELIGRVVDALGTPIDGRGDFHNVERKPIEHPAPPITHRAAVSDPLQTGIKVIDALFPIGRGQRELIVGDRQTGKTAIALDTIINQKETGVLCIYCAIGQRGSAVAKLLSTLEEYDALRYTTVVVAPGDSAPGIQFIAPYAATTIAEGFMEQGRDVLIVYDDLTRHARSYRELSLLLRRPPGREAYPGDIFYLHSRLLERSTHLKPEYGGGSITSLPIVETQSQNISAYIPTNLISITDGQIVLTTEQFRRGVLPAVDVGRSVSRVGGKAQLPCFRAVVGELRLTYSQFEELEVFARFGTRLDDDTAATLERGRRVRETFKQPQYEPMRVGEQLSVLMAAAQGLLNAVPTSAVAEAESEIRQRVAREVPDVLDRMEAGEKFSKEDRERLTYVLQKTTEKIASANAAQSSSSAGHSSSSSMKDE